MTDFTERYATACTFTQTVDKARIRDALTRWTHGKLPIQFLNTQQDAVFAVVESDALRRYLTNTPSVEAAVRYNALFTHMGVQANVEAYLYQHDYAALSLRQQVWRSAACEQAYNALSQDVFPAVRQAWDISWTTAILAGMEAKGDRAEFDHWFPLFEAFEAGAWLFFPARTALYVMTLPVVKLDAQNRLHSATEAALAYLDRAHYYWQGQRIGAGFEWLVRHPEHLTIDFIDRVQNVRLQTIAIEQYTLERMYREGLLTAWGTEDQWGALYYRAIQRTETESLWVLKVTNTTPEPDGSYRNYFIRVPAWMDTPREAVAWTFGYDDPEAYQPQSES